ncbi:extracellular trypsin protease [Metarhizium guizhouense ARSEF 977]|uniref:Extracellular trypsin protease n=1 Tax=Metarhizium guizhouense (strain ARSEF 977) TaxID=1276136 RepID=A0A0B4H206_METGA|nr:extracellular trypsin protease [Metarhizium guizhouense ARSEF 977]
MVRITAITLAATFFATSAAAATIDKRIVGGEDVLDGDIKFIVSLRDQNGTHVCGGSLLDSTTVLTAAHCLISEEIHIVSVTAGTVSTKTGGVNASVASVEKHPGYKPGAPSDCPVDLPWDECSRRASLPGDREENDIAILKLSTPIEKSDTIDYVRLPLAGGDAAVNSTGISAGWGAQTPLESSVPKDGEGKPIILAEKLSKVLLDIHAREDCAAKYKNQRVGDRDTIICAGGQGKNPCKGDSGGPLFHPETKELLGVVSWSIRDRIEDDLCNKTPTVFTRVGSYIDWINGNLGSRASSRLAAVRHCTRPDTDVAQCFSALLFCQAREVSPDAPELELLECIDRIQICADQDQCVANAKVCKEQEKLPVGDLVNLARCAKKDL